MLKIDMASSLPSEFNKFCRLTKQLRQIHRDTQKCYRDINTAGNFEQGKFKEATHNNYSKNKV